MVVLVRRKATSIKFERCLSGMFRNKFLKCVYQSFWKWLTCSYIWTYISLYNKNMPMCNGEKPAPLYLFYTWMSGEIDTIFHEIFKKFRNVTFYVHIWHKEGKCFKMNTNKPMFGPVVLRIACGISISNIFVLLKHVRLG